MQNSDGKSTKLKLKLLIVIAIVVVIVINYLLWLVLAIFGSSEKKGVDMLSAKYAYEQVEEYCKSCIDEGITLPDEFEGENYYYCGTVDYDCPYIAGVISEERMDEFFDANSIVRTDEKWQEEIVSAAMYEFGHLMSKTFIDADAKYDEGIEGWAPPAGFAYKKEEITTVGTWVICLDDEGLPEWVAINRHTGDKSEVEVYPENANEDGEDIAELVDRCEDEVRIAAANEIAAAIYSAVNEYATEASYEWEALTAGKYTITIDTEKKGKPDPTMASYDSTGEMALVVGDAVSEEYNGSMAIIYVSESGYPQSVAWAEDSESECVGRYPTEASGTTPGGIKNIAM